MRCAPTSWRIVLLVLVLHLLGFQLLSWAGSGLRYSWFFRLDVARKLRAEEERRRASLEHIDRLVASGWKVPAVPGSNTSSNATKICIAFVSTGSVTHTARKEAHYLLQAVSSLVRNVRPDEWRFLQMYLVAPYDGGDADLLRKIMPAVNVTPQAWSFGPRLHFARALELCSERAPYAVVLEDDVIAGRDLVPALLGIIDSLEEGRGRAERDWAFVKLWFTEYWEGWGRDNTWLLALLALALAVPCCSVARYRLQFRLWTALLLGAHAGLLLAAVLFLLGRQHVLPTIGSGLVEWDPGCCTPAVLYNSRQAHHIVEFLRCDPACPSYAHDLMVSLAARGAGLRTLHYTPHLFQHIGRYSSGAHKNQGDWLTMKESMTFRG